MAIIKSNDCGGLSVGGGTTVNVSQSNCNCGCGGGTGGGGTGGVLPPELGGPPVPTGHGGGGTGGSGDGTGHGGGPGGSIGSGTGGDPNGDGQDQKLAANSCIPLNSPPNQDFGSSGFELANLDIAGQINTAAASIPGFTPGDKIISAALQVDGLCWTGFSILGGPLTPNRKLSVTDSLNAKHQVAFTEERTGLSYEGVGISSLSYRYGDSFSVDMTGDNGIKIDGQLPRSPIGIDINGADKNSPSWLKVALCSIVTRPKGVYGFSFSFAPADIDSGAAAIWDSQGVGVRAYMTQLTHYAPNSTWNSDYAVTGALGGSSMVVLSKPCPAAYTKLSGSFKHGNFDYTPTGHFQMEEYSQVDGSLIALVGSEAVIGPMPSTGGTPGDYANNLVSINYEVDFPALTPGHFYRLWFQLDASIGIDDLVGTFAV